MVRNLPHLVYFENSNARVGVYMWRKRVPRLKIAASHTHKCISLNRSSITHLAEDRGTNLSSQSNVTIVMSWIWMLSLVYSKFVLFITSFSYMTIGNDLDAYLTSEFGSRSGRAFGRETEGRKFESWSGL